jgi:hypothetical protein
VSPPKAGDCVSSVGGPRRLPRRLRCHQSQQTELGVVVAAGGGAARPELDPQRLSPMADAAADDAEVFSSVLRILIILFPARPLTTERNDAQCPQERLRPTGAASQRAEILGPASTILTHSLFEVDIGNTW